MFSDFSESGLESCLFKSVIRSNCVIRSCERGNNYVCMCVCVGDGIWSTFRRSALNIVVDSLDTMDAATVSHRRHQSCVRKYFKCFLERASQPAQICVLIHRYYMYTHSGYTNSGVASRMIEDDIASRNSIPTRAIATFVRHFDGIHKIPVITWMTDVLGKSC